jgi:FkbM family methyltransferase
VSTEYQVNKGSVIDIGWPLHAPRFHFGFCDPGHKDHIHDNYLRKGVFYEEDLLQLLASLNLGDGLVVDIGSYVGSHAIFFAGIMGRSVVSIEANRDSFELLSRNIELNALSERVLPLCKAAADRSGLTFRNRGSLIANQGATEFVLAEDNLDGLSVEDLLIESVAVDDLGLDRVALVKIDVEGMELEVLKGLSKTIDSFKPVLAIECMSVIQFSQVAAWCHGIGYLPIARKAVTPVLVFAHKLFYDVVCHGCPPPSWASLVP